MDGHDDEIMTKYFGPERSTLLHEHLDPWIGHVRLDGCIPQEKGCVGTAMEGKAPGSSAHGSDSTIAATSAAGNPSAATMKPRRLHLLEPAQ
jgi:hypothetical protein